MKPSILQNIVEFPPNGAKKSHAATSIKTWKKTRLQNMVRHRSGRYYARAFAHGKEVWKTLGTSHFGVAQAKLTEFLQEHRARRQQGTTLTDAKMTFGAALGVHKQALRDNPNIKPSDAAGIRCDVPKIRHLGIQADLQERSKC